MPNLAPHTDYEIAQMLSELGLAELDDLYRSIPRDVRLKRPLSIEPGLSEVEVIEAFQERASRNAAARRDLVVFCGGGSYDHDLSAAARALGSQAAFVTAYTPYQPEVAQGVLQALFEFQTMVARIFGMEVANASLYDGAAALVEAINLAVGAGTSRRVILSNAINPTYQETVTTFGAGTGLTLEIAPFSSELTTEFDYISGEAAALVVGYPNFLGAIEDLERARAKATELGALLIVVADPLAMGMLRPPGEFGADVVVGEGQCLGLPLSFGGPYLGLFTTTARWLRLVPGRLVGETVDIDGKRAYVTTLRTREQDIRRERATSNVCTNQTLMAIQSAIHLSWLGTQGFEAVARANFDATHYLADRLSEIPGVSIRSNNFFRECVVDLPVSGEIFISRMLKRGYLAGIALGPKTGKSTFDTSVLVTATEARTRVEIDEFVGNVREEVSR
ncbi:MAG: aminomethyl-transferring glycine dehydrogenase subunit GcvPA [Ferrimicrobium sp.]